MKLHFYFAGLSRCTCWIHVQLTDTSSHPRNDSFPKTVSDKPHATNLLHPVVPTFMSSFIDWPQNIQTYKPVYLGEHLTFKKFIFKCRRAVFLHKTTENITRILSPMKHCWLFMQIIHSKILNNQFCKWGVILGIFCECSHAISPSNKTPLLHQRPDKQGIFNTYSWKLNKTQMTRQKK